MTRPFDRRDLGFGRGVARSVTGGDHRVSKEEGDIPDQFLHRPVANDCMRAVLHMSVREYGYIARGESGAISQGPGRRTLNEAFIGDVGVRPLVDANEDRASRLSDRQSMDCAICQYIHPERNAEPLPHPFRNHSHAGGGFRANLARLKERYVAVVLHDQSVQPSGDVRVGIGQGTIDDSPHGLAVVKRRARQRQAVHHADQHLFPAENPPYRVGTSCGNAFGLFIHGQTCMIASDAIVIGNVAVDETFAVPALPCAGESLLADPPTRDLGGKGANQAVVLARAGMKVRFVARMASDDEGHFVHSRLATEQLDGDLIRGPQPTDRSILLLDPNGENCIVTTAAAVRAMTPADAERAMTGAPDGSLLLLQGNLAFPTTRAALVAARARNMTAVFNPTPVTPEFASLWPLVSLTVLNEREATLLAAAAGEDGLRRIIAGGAQSAVITLGERGAILMHEGGLETVPAEPAEVVDTTGAGDTFTAVLAAARFGRGLSWKHALVAAAKSAAITVASRGAFASLPSRAALSDMFRRLTDHA